jgi:SSS family transporter
MLLALTSVDYLVLVFYLGVMLAIGFYFSRQQHSSDDFFLAGRSMGAAPLGLSIMVTLMSALSYTGVPGESYFEGLKLLLQPLAIWLTLPLMFWLFLPLYRNLRLFSIYEYLELRFDGRTRLLASGAFIFWRLLWLGGVLYAPCTVLVVAAELPIPEWVLLLTLGLVGTAYTFLGGMKAVIWTDVIQSIVMLLGLILIIGAVWLQLDGGYRTVWETAERLHRDQILDRQFSWTEKWSVWAMLPHFMLAMLSFYVADQITAQRYLTASTLKAARQSFLLNCISVTVMYSLLAYTGIALLAFYQAQPEALRPEWVVNVDPETGTAMLDPATGSRMLPRGEPILPETIDALAAAGKIVDPNRRQPVSPDLPLVNEAGQVDLNLLAARRSPELGGEMIVSREAQDELMPRFIVEQLPLGLAGLIMAALLAASMSSMDSGLNSIAALVISDYHRRLGLGRRWLARRVGKPVGQLSEHDEIALARPLVLIIGVLATLCSLFIGNLGDIFSIMVGAINTFGGPLLALFLLGVLTRRTTATAATVALIGGLVFTLWLSQAGTGKLLSWSWPFASYLSDTWIVVFSVPFTMLLGYAVSFFMGEPKCQQELRGLVWGKQPLGERAPAVESASIAIDLPEDPERRK